MLISPAGVKSYGDINVNVDEVQTGAAIRIAQNVYLVDILGRDLVEHLQQLVFNKISGESEDTIDSEGNEAYKTLLDEFVRPVLAYRTVVELCIKTSLKIRNMGVVKNQDTKVNPTDWTDYSRLRDYYETFFVDAVNKMMDFLCQNKTAFMELPDGFCTCERKPLYGRTKLWLG